MAEEYQGVCVILLILFGEYLYVKVLIYLYYSKSTKSIDLLSLGE
jgi:hypothetical protein